MKPKNVMLLGFVNSAVEYLDKHMDEQPDTRLAELKNIDLASLRDELSDNLDTSLGTMQSTMATLLKAGNEAFDKFIEDSRGKTTIADEFDRLFDIDFDDARKNNQQELAKLLSFYNLDSDFDFGNCQEIGAPVLNEKEFGVTDVQDYASSPDDEKFLQEIIKNAGGNVADNTTSTANSIPNTDELDSIFTEIVDNEQPVVKDANFVTKDKPVENADKGEPLSNKQYVSSLIDDLKSELEKEETLRREKEIKNKDIYNRIHELYNYLPMSFIKVVYDLKEPIAKEYPNDKKVIVLHRVSFKDVDDLRKFVEIGLNHEYSINADEKKMIVDIFKEVVNSDGVILSNIYEIANQGCLLNGNYEGYNVIINEEE